MFGLNAMPIISLPSKRLRSASISWKPTPPFEMNLLSLTSVPSVWLISESAASPLLVKTLLRMMLPLRPSSASLSSMPASMWPSSVRSCTTLNVVPPVSMTP